MLAKKIAIQRRHWYKLHPNFRNEIFIKRREESLLIVRDYVGNESHYYTMSLDEIKVIAESILTYYGSKHCILTYYGRDSELVKSMISSMLTPSEVIKQEGLGTIDMLAIAKRAKRIEEQSINKKQGFFRKLTNLIFN